MSHGDSIALLALVGQSHRLELRHGVGEVCTAADCVIPVVWIKRGLGPPGLTKLVLIMGTSFTTRGFKNQNGVIWGQQ